MREAEEQAQAAITKVFYYAFAAGILIGAVVATVLLLVFA